MAVVRANATIRCGGSDVGHRTWPSVRYWVRGVGWDGVGESNPKYRECLTRTEYEEGHEDLAGIVEPLLASPGDFTVVGVCECGGAGGRGAVARTRARASVGKGTGAVARTQAPAQARRRCSLASVVMNLIVITVPYRSMNMVLWRASPSTEIQYAHLSMIATMISNKALKTK